MSQALKIDNPIIETNLNTIFEQDGRVYAVCSHNVPAKDLAKFIREKLIYGSKCVPRYKMRVVSSEEFRKMPFGKPQETNRNIKNEVNKLMASQTAVIEKKAETETEPEREATPPKPPVKKIKPGEEKPS